MNSLINTTVRPVTKLLRRQLSWLRKWTRPLRIALLELTVRAFKTIWSVTLGAAWRAGSRKLLPLVKPRVKAAWIRAKPRIESALDRASPKLEYYTRRWFLPKLDKEQLVGLIAVAAAELSNREVEARVLSIIDSLPTESQRKEARTLAKSFAANPNSMLLLSGAQNSATVQLLATLNETVANITSLGEEVFGTGLGLVASSPSSALSSFLPSPSSYLSPLTLLPNGSSFPSFSSSSSSPFASALNDASSSSSSPSPWSPSSAALTALLALGSRDAVEDALVDLDQKTRTAVKENLELLTSATELTFPQFYEVFAMGPSSAQGAGNSSQQLRDLTSLWTPLWEDHRAELAEAFKAGMDGGGGGGGGGGELETLGSPGAALKGWANGAGKWWGQVVKQQAVPLAAGMAKNLNSSLASYERAVQGLQRQLLDQTTSNNNNANANALRRRSKNEDHAESSGKSRSGSSGAETSSSSKSSGSGRSSGSIEKRADGAALPRVRARDGPPLLAWFNVKAASSVGSTQEPSSQVGAVVFEGKAPQALGKDTALAVGSDLAAGASRLASRLQLTFFKPQGRRKDNATEADQGQRRHQLKSQQQPVSSVDTAEVTGAEATGAETAIAEDVSSEVTGAETASAESVSSEVTGAETAGAKTTGAEENPRSTSDTGAAC